MPRPRAFDLPTAVDRGTHLLWSKGYEATSLDDLLLAMGIGKSSFYAVFRSKRDFLFKALDQPLIGPLVERVSQRRIDFVTDAFRQAGFDPVTAANRARLAYSAYVGFIQLAQIGQPRMSHEEFEAYIRDFIEILIPR